MKDKEEMIDIELNLPPKLAKDIRSMTKVELTNRLIVMILKSQNQDEAKKELESEIDDLNRTVKETNNRLDKCESYVEQGRSMVEAIMEKWYHYD